MFFSVGGDLPSLLCNFSFIFISKQKNARIRYLRYKNKSSLLNFKVSNYSIYSLNSSTRILILNSIYINNRYRNIFKPQNYKMCII